MNFGQNLFNWFLPQAQALAMVAFLVMAVAFAVQRKISAVLTTIVVGVLVILLLYNTEGVKNVLLQLGNKVIGS